MQVVKADVTICLSAILSVQTVEGLWKNNALCRLDAGCHDHLHGGWDLLIASFSRRSPHPLHHRHCLAAAPSACRPEGRAAAVWLPSCQAMAWVDTLGRGRMPAESGTIWRPAQQCVRSSAWPPFAQLQD